LAKIAENNNYNIDPPDPGSFSRIQVEASDASKKANKLLPRTSVLDKLKTDLGGKQPERCVSLIGKKTLLQKLKCMTSFHPKKIIQFRAINLQPPQG
jgi:hypothetical protein